MLKRGSSELEDNELGLAYHVQYFVSLMAAIFASVILLIGLHPAPFGIELAVAIIYTAAAWWQTFCRIRGDNSSYRIQTAAVRQKVPRLLSSISDSWLFFAAVHSSSLFYDFTFRLIG